MVSSCEGGNQEEKGDFSAWLAQGPPEAVDRYQQARRVVAAAVKEKDGCGRSMVKLW